jgi:hypothetical protein
MLQKPLLPAICGAKVRRAQKRFLQYLQLSCPTKQWILKSPDHVHTLEHLLTVFPDAVVIQTHRNPLEVGGLGSNGTEKAVKRRY